MSLKVLFNKRGKYMFKRHNLSSVLGHIKEKGFSPKSIIDVGIAYGTPGLYGVFENAQYLLVEPLEEYTDVMEDICSKFNAKYVIAAAGAEITETVINVHPDMSGSSILKESEGEHIDGEPRTVKVTTLDFEAKKAGLTGPYLIKLDVQGFELEVLKGASEIIKNTDVVIMETSLFQFYKNSPEFHEVIAFMADMDFSVYDIFGASYRPLDDALGQVDILFVRNGCFLRGSDHYATPEQREKMTQERVKNLNPKKGAKL